MAQERRLKVIMVPDTFRDRRPTPCGYIRLVLPLTKQVSARYLDVRVASSAWSRDDHFDVLVAQRLALPTMATIDAAVALCRDRGARFVYDIDDDLLAIGLDHPDHKELAGMQSVVRHALACADQVWVSTDEMMQRYRTFASNIVVVPNTLDGRVWKPRLPGPPSSRKPARFLYMGTVSHRQDFFDIVEPAFKRLIASTRRRVSLELIGIVPGGKGDFWSSLSPSGRFGSLYPVFSTWLQSLDQFDVGIAPLKDTYFNAAKSDVKWLEYSGMGLATIAADLPPYRDTIRHGENGLLCAADPDAWFEALNRLMTEGVNPIREAASADVRQRIAMSDAVEPRVALLQSLIGYPRNLNRSDFAK